MSSEPIKTWWVTAGDEKDYEILGVAKTKDQAEKALVAESERRAFRILGITLEQFQKALTTAKQQLKIECYESRKTDERA